MRTAPVVLAALLLGACAETRLATHAAKQATRAEPSAPQPGPARGGYYKVGNPYQINGVWYYPKEDPNYDETGIASWYGPGFHGKMTANGETYDMNDVTAAHQTLPMPSLVRVTNLENGRSIVVRINDRGPFVNGRIIDLSRRSAQLLGVEQRGTAKVRVQYAGPATGDGGIAQPAAPPAPAEDRPVMAAAPRSGVAVEAVAPPPGARGAAGPARPVPAASGPSATEVMAAARQQGGGVTPDLQRQQVREVPVRPAAIWVQAGAFTLFDNANRLGARLSTMAPTQVSSLIVNGTEYFRVRLGPFNDSQQADRTLNALIANGTTDARIVVD